MLLPRKLPVWDKGCEPIEGDEKEEDEYTTLPDGSWNSDNLFWKFEFDPDDKKKAQKLEGEIPSPVNPPSGCKFHTRCPLAEDLCKKEIPQWKNISKDHITACHFV